MCAKSNYSQNLVKRYQELAWGAHIPSIWWKYMYCYLIYLNFLIYIIQLQADLNTWYIPDSFSPHSPSNKVTNIGAVMSSTQPIMLPAFNCSSRRFACRTTPTTNTRSGSVLKGLIPPAATNSSFSKSMSKSRSRPLGQKYWYQQKGLVIRDRCV